jgi:hypothetical protein
MKSAIKITLIVICTFAVVVIGYGIYFVSQISAVYPPLKEYDFSVNAMELQAMIFEVDQADTNLYCTITDTIGLKDDRTYCMAIGFKKLGVNYGVRISYADHKKFLSNTINSELRLIGVYDSTNKLGGYLPEDNGVPKLIDVFEKEFVSKLEGN